MERGSHVMRLLARTSITVIFKPDLRMSTVVRHGVTSETVTGVRSKGVSPITPLIVRMTEAVQQEWQPARPAAVGQLGGQTASPAVRTTSIQNIFGAGSQDAW